MFSANQEKPYTITSNGQNNLETRNQMKIADHYPVVKKGQAHNAVSMKVSASFHENKEIKSTSSDQK